MLPHIKVTYAYVSNALFLIIYTLKNTFIHNNIHSKCAQYYGQQLVGIFAERKSNKNRIKGLLNLLNTVVYVSPVFLQCTWTE